jgi:hypothetical protein
LIAGAETRWYLHSSFGLAFRLAVNLRAAYDVFPPNKDRYGTTDVEHFVETGLRYDM